MLRLQSQRWNNIRNGFYHLHPKHRSWVTDLPAEVLEIIFLHYSHDPEPCSFAPDGTRSTFSSQARSIVNPMILGGVSKQWRDVSRGLRPLWAKIFISEPTRRHVDLADLWLSLAAPSLLTLAVTSNEPEYSHQLLKLFFSYYDAWHIIDIRISIEPNSYLPVPNYYRLRLPSYPPPFLSSIHFAVDNALPLLFKDDSRPIDLLHASPHLKRVQWNSRRYSLVQALEKFPTWSSLAHLVCSENCSDVGTSSTVADCVKILMSCPTLESLDVMIFPYPPSNSASTPVAENALRHSCLRKLAVKTSAIYFHQLFKSLILPGLRELDMQYLFFLSSDLSGLTTDAHVVQDLLERSSCEIHDLSLETPFASDNSLLDLLFSPQLRHVRNLRLTGFMTTQAINLLTRNFNDIYSLSILPQLQRLTFCNKEPFRLVVPIASLKRMLVSRTKPFFSVEGNNSLSLLKFSYLDLHDMDYRDYCELRSLGNADFTIVPTDLDVKPTVWKPVMHFLQDARHWIRET